jgi:hypothetical protein
LRVKLTNLYIPKIDARTFIDLLEAENLKSKNLADEYAAFMPADVAAVVHSTEQNSLGVDELNNIARKYSRAWLIYAAWSCIV